MGIERINTNYLSADKSAPSLGLGFTAKLLQPRKVKKVKGKKVKLGWYLDDIQNSFEILDIKFLKKLLYKIPFKNPIQM